MRPTIITNVPDSSRLMTEEIFGPIVCIVPFDTEEEVIFVFFHNFSYPLPIIIQRGILEQHFRSKSDSKG